MSESHPTLPAASIDEALPLLARPFPPEAVSFKIQAQGGGSRERPQATWAQVVGYLNARDVIGRLNQVAGGAWSARYRPLDEELRPPRRNPESTVWAVCELTVLGVCRSDVGEAEDSEHVRAPKGAYSDALKRAAVHFGIGHVLYAMPAVFMGAGQGRADRLEARRDKLVLRARNAEHLRACYRGFLEQEGTRHFGEVLDHGARAGGVELEAESSDSDQSSGGGEGSVERILSAAERGGYSADVAAGLAALMVGRSELAALEPDEAEVVAGHLERAAVGEVAPTTLAGQLTRALNVSDREGARRRFAEWLERRSGERATGVGRWEAA